MVHEVREGGVGQGPQGLVSGPALAQQNILIKKLLHQRHELGAEVRGEDVAGRDEELLPEVGHLVRADGQQGQHPLHHLGGVLRGLRLVDADDVGQEAQRLDLSSHEVHKDFFVEGWTLPEVLGRDEGDGVHDERDKLGHLHVNLLLVQLVHQHHDDGQFLQNFQGQHSFGDEAVGEVGRVVRSFLLCLHRGDGEGLRQLGLDVQLRQIFHLDGGPGLEYFVEMLRQFVVDVLDEPEEVSDLRGVGGPELLMELNDDPETDQDILLVVNLEQFECEGENVLGEWFQHLCCW